VLVVPVVLAVRVAPVVPVVSVALVVLVVPVGSRIAMPYLWTMVIMLGILKCGTNSKPMREHMRKRKQCVNTYVKQCGKSEHCANAEKHSENNA
jgi:hypothetical protein